MKAAKLLQIVLFLILLINLCIGFRVYSSCADKDGSGQIRARMNLFFNVLQLVRKNYVDGDKVNGEALMQRAVNGLVTNLDPYTNVLPPEATQQLKEETEGEFGGIGLSVSLENGKVSVISTIAGTPAHEAGIQTGDIIVAVDDFRADNSSLEECVRRMRGAVGTKVTLGIQRENTPEELRFELTRAMIPIESVDGVGLLPGTSLGYLRIIQFMEPTASDVEKGLRALKEQNLTGLIVDLRGNPGGLLKSAVEICSFFLPENQIIVSVEGRNPQENYQEKSGKGYKFPAECPVVILINESSASASEITAGCLRDLDRATLIGEKSYGKGSVQTVYPLPDGFALKLTVAKYYTPARRVIHEAGIQPDIPVEMTAEEFYQSARLPLEKRLITDKQLLKAVEFLQESSNFKQDKGNRKND